MRAPAPPGPPTAPRRSYEDGDTHPGHPFACGLTLDRLSGYTVDAEGREAFVTNNPLAMLRKVGGRTGVLTAVGKRGASVANKQPAGRAAQGAGRT